MSIKDFPTIKKKGVSLDISNAFNSLPWDRIGRALEGSLPIYDASFGPTYRIDGSIAGTTIWSLLPGLCTAGFRRDQSWAPTCGTSGTMLCSEKFSFPQAATSFVTRTIIAAGRDWGEAKSLANEATASCATSRTLI